MTVYPSGYPRSKSLMKAFDRLMKREDIVESVQSLDKTYKGFLVYMQRAERKPRLLLTGSARHRRL